MDGATVATLMVLARKEEEAEMGGREERTRTVNRRAGHGTVRTVCGRYARADTREASKRESRRGRKRRTSCRTAGL